MKTEKGKGESTLTRLSSHDGVLFALVLLLSALLFFPLSPKVMSQLDNESIESRVNVTNAVPEVRQIRMYSEAFGPGTDITLTEGTTTHVMCNATIVDKNGYQDINNTHAHSNGTIWDSGVAVVGTTNDNNYHYTNTTCTLTQINSSWASFACSFQVEYYANNNTAWLCNVSVQDLEGSPASNESEATTIDPLFAINVTTNTSGPHILDFGNMIPDNTTTNADERTVNITNTGNVNISFSVEGYAHLPGDEEALNCTIGEISTADLRYELFNDVAFASMYNLTRYQAPLFVPAGDGTIFQRVDDADTDQSDSTNATWWKIYVPAGTKGFCNGTVIISAAEI